MSPRHYIVGISAALLAGTLLGRFLFPTLAEERRQFAAPGEPVDRRVSALPDAVSARSPEAVRRMVEAGRLARNPSRVEYEIEARIRQMTDSEVLAIAAQLVAGELVLSRYETGFLTSIWRRYAGLDPAAAHRDALLLPTRDMRSNAVRIAATAWAQADPARALQEMISAESDGIVEISSLGAALKVLVEDDPAEAIAALEGHRDAGWYSRARGSLFYHWAQFDEAAASGWLIGQMEDGPQAAGGVLLDLASHDPARAIELALGMGPGVGLRDAVGEIIVGRWMWRDRDAALAALRELPPEWHSPYAAENFGRNAVTSSSFEEIESLASVFPAGAIRNEFWNGVIGRRASDARFDDAVTLLAHLEEGERAGAAGDLATYWAKANPSEASEWLRSLETGAVRDRAVGRFARTIAPIDPGSARHWAETIADPGERERALRSLGDG